VHDHDAGTRVVRPGGHEGQKGWKQVVSGDVSVALDPGCSRVHDVMTKRYVAETHARSAVEGVIELATARDVDHERFTERFEVGEMPATVEVEMTDGTTHVVEKAAFQGHPTNAIDWGQVEAKFHDVASDHLDGDRRDALVDVVQEVERHDVDDLVELLA
jgi:2-methylcitrate dehydratase PrpD